jgi:hypothetical protein
MKSQILFILCPDARDPQGFSTSICVVTADRTTNPARTLCNLTCYPSLVLGEQSHLFTGLPGLIDGAWDSAVAKSEHTKTGIASKRLASGRKSETPTAPCGW